MLHQATQSAIKGRLEIVEAQSDGQLVNINIDHMLTRLQDDSSQDGRVHANRDGAKLLHKEIIRLGNPEGECSINVIAKTPSIGGSNKQIIRSMQ